jgi:hypothetical protein
MAKTKSTDKNSNPNPKIRSEVAFLTDYRTWARLNLKGKIEWGEFFPDSKVPVKSIVTQNPILEDTKDVESAFTVNWKELTHHQQEAIVEKLSKQTQTTKETILKRILTHGLPLRRTHTLCCGKVDCNYSFREGDFLV